MVYMEKIFLSDINEILHLFLEGIEGYTAITDEKMNKFKGHNFSPKLIPNPKENPTELFFSQVVCTLCLEGHKNS